MLEPRRLQRRAVCVDLDHLVAADETDRIEVVDVEVPEDAAGGCEVVLGRRKRVVRRRTHREDAAHAAVRDRIAECPVALVEAALEADLDEYPRSRDFCDHGVQRLEVECDRLLAERCHR